MEHRITHLGIIPDGNRRWAKNLGKKPWHGHEKGIPRFHNVIDWCVEKGITEITFYTLSVQNFKRNKIELDFLFKFIRKELDDWLDGGADDKGIFLNPVGRLNLLPKDIEKKALELKEKTKSNTKIKVNLAIGYGGREEIIESVKKTVESNEEINEETISKNLWIPTTPDLVIRTSGEVRTSNFLVWQTAYSEWYFCEKMWPDFSKEEFLKALDNFENRNRRYGK